MIAPACVGIDVGGTKALGVALDDRGTRLAEVRVPTPNDGEGLVDALAGIAEQLGGDGRVGVGMPGLVTRDGVLISGPNVSRIRHLPLRQMLAERLGRDVVVDNDNTVAALAEWRLGAGRGADDMLLVGQGTGIGGGVISGGVLQHGSNGFGGEFGHVVVDPGGPACPCGRRGCWERYASGSGLGFLAREAATMGQLPGVLAEVGGIEGIRGEHIRSAAARGDREALAVIETFSSWVALGLMNLTNIFDPQVIVLSGGLSADGDLFLPPIVRQFESMQFVGEARPLPRVVSAQLGAYAGAVGAALLAQEGG